MKYKLLTVDFDDTLLRSDFTLSPSSCKAASDFISGGGIFTVATGRMYCSLKTYLDRLPVNAPVAVYQGALVVDSTTDKILYKCTMDKTLTCEVLKYLEKENLYAQIYFDDRLYFVKREEHSAFYEKISNIKGFETIIPLSDFVEKNNIDATKILVMLPADKGQKMVEAIKNKFGDVLSVNRTKPTFIEITNSKAGKECAVQYLAQSFGIKQSEIVCVGDSYNDLNMIKYAGLGVAMGNAFDDVKKAADLVIESNDDNGVARLIYKLLEDKIKL